MNAAVHLAQKFLGDFAFHQKFTRKTNHKAIVRGVTKIEQRQWIDVEPVAHDSKSSEVAREMNTLLRQGSLPGEEDGAIEFRRLKSMFASRFATSPYWSDPLCTRHLERRRSQKEIPVLCSTAFTRYNSPPSSNPRSCRRESS